MTRQEIPVFKTREENVAYMNETLPIQESFDLIQRDLLIGGRVSSFYFVNGFTANSDDLEIIRNGGEYEIKEDHGCTSEGEGRRDARGCVGVCQRMHSIR